MGPHEEFLKLCALSAGGEITSDERKKLDEHLAGCAECREALKQFEIVVDQAIPALAPDLVHETIQEDPYLFARLGRGVLFQEIVGRGREISNAVARC